MPDELHSARLLLRPFRSNDAETLFRLRSDPDQMHYLDREPMQTVGEAAEMIVRILDDGQKGAGYNWAIEQSPGAGMIGYAGIWRIDSKNSRGEIGYMLGSAHQGNGLMTEALMSVLRFAFTEAGLHAVEAHVNPGNARSIRVLERCGFIREAYFRENYKFRDTFLDTAVYCLLSADFKITT